MKSIYSTQNWHKRFQQQATWTQNLRKYIYNRAGLTGAKNILDVGCGTGVLELELITLTQARLFGVDINLSHLEMAIRSTPRLNLIQADGLSLPFPDQYFDFSLCHFLLLWVSEPIQVLHEMVRTTRSGGAVLVLAEPDYGGRVDYPSELSLLGRWQQTALFAQGANPQIGRQISALLHKAGLSQIETGVLGGQWQDLTDQADWESEWDLLENDLTWLNPGQIDPEQLREFKKINARAYKNGERVLFVPTFYGWGRVT